MRPHTRPNPATPTAPPDHDWPLIHATTILPQADPDTEARVSREIEAYYARQERRPIPAEVPADPDAPRCHGPRADTCTQAPTGPCLPRVCPGCLSSDTPETYHHHCHGKAAQTPSTCARPQAAEAAQTCQGGAAQTDPR